jgi:3-oxoacyl-[acyl-carrier-protein] synthase III
VSQFRSVIKGSGAYLPKKILSNKDLSALVDTSDEWIYSRTGIRRRHIAADDELTSDLGRRAAQDALSHAGVDPVDVDMIVLATTTPDSTFPATAARIQAQLGVTTGAAFDVQAVCAGFIYALGVADNFIKLGQAGTVLVIGAETYSRILDWTDRSTSVLFGDGAGALVVQAEQANGDRGERGILSTHLHTDGRYYDLLYVDGGPSSTQTTGHLRMQGPEVFRHAVSKLADVVEEALEANNLAIEDVDWLVPHQANKRIIEGTTKKLGLPPERVILTVQDHANTSAASIPLALAQGAKDGRIKPGQIVLCEAIGGGLSWGSAIIRW